MRRRMMARVAAIISQIESAGLRPTASAYRSLLAPSILVSTRMPNSSPHRRSNSSAGASTVRPARNAMAASSSTGSTVALMRRSPPEASTSASQSRKSRHATALVAILCPLRSWRENANSSMDSPAGGPRNTNARYIRLRGSWWPARTCSVVPVRRSNEPSANASRAVISQHLPSLGLYASFLHHDAPSRDIARKEFCQLLRRPSTNLNALLGRKLDHVRLAHNLVDCIVIARDDLVWRSCGRQQPEPQLRLDAVEA